MAKKTGAELIAKEREEQTEKHGYRVQDDYDLYKGGQLNEVAASIVLGDVRTFPWAYEIYRKIMAKPRVEQLAVAGAIIAAEIDRLNYRDEIFKQPKVYAHGENCKHVTTLCPDCIRRFNEWQEEQRKKKKECVECKEKEATRDYNGHGHFVCDDCYGTLEKEFERYEN